MANNNRTKIKFPGFAGYLSRMDKVDNFPEISPTRLSSSPIELLSFDELLSQDTTSAAANASQGPQGNKNTVRLPPSCPWRCPSPQKKTMAHWHNDTNNGFPANPNSLLNGDFPESNVRGTAMPVGDMDNTNRNIAGVTSDVRPGATERDIFAYLDGLEDVEPPSDKDMGGKLVYGKRWFAVRSASSSIKAESNAGMNDTDSEDVDMDEEETIHDVIVVSSGKGSQALGQNCTVHAKNVTVGTSSGNTTVILSSSSETQPEDQRGRQGNNGRRDRVARQPSSEKDYIPSHSSGEETEIREDEHQTEYESPVPTPTKKQFKQKGKQKGAYYYFATGLHMGKGNMKKDFPGSIHRCPAKLKGYRWLRCGPRRYDRHYVATRKDPFPGNKDPEGYATIAPVYKDIVYNRSNMIVQQSDELDLEGSCVYGSLYEVSEEDSRAIVAETLKWNYKPAMVTVIPLEKDLSSVEPGLAGSMPLILREIPGEDGKNSTVEACTYLVDGKGWHLPWRQPDINCGGHMEVGRLRDHERTAMVDYMYIYNLDNPPSNTPYPLPQFALDRRNEIPRPLSNDFQPQVYPEPYMKALRDVFFDMLFDGMTPLWYVNEVLRPWVKDLPDWPHPHGKRDVKKEDDEELYD